MQDCEQEWSDPHGAILGASGNGLPIMAELQQQHIIHVASKPAGLLRLRPVNRVQVKPHSSRHVPGCILL